MRITIVTVGSRGDVQPYVALGAGLLRAGHVVRMPTPAAFRDLIREQGIEWVETRGVDPQAFLQSARMQTAAKSGSQIGFLRTMFREAVPLVRGFLDEVWQSVQGSDLIVATAVPFGALDSAERLGVPCVQALVNPLFPTSAFANPALSLPLSSPRINRLTHHFVDQAFWQPFRPILNRWRREVLGLPPIGFWGPYAALRARRVPTLFGYSPSVLPVPYDWPASARVTGYWFLDEPAGWQPPSELSSFLEAGPPPVCVGFGSMVDRAASRMADIVYEALRLSGQRGIVSAGWSGLGAVDAVPNVLRIGSVPHAWLFPRMAAVVHHGGAGTTAAGLRAGVPSIVTPFLGDQQFWGERVAALEVGPRPISYHRLTALTLANLIHEAVTSGGMRERAAALGERIRAETGVENAVREILGLRRP